jgi:Acetyltransferases, including N-acetylases of ribosomal proteins
MDGWQPPVLVSKRLRLRAIELEDANSLFMYAQDKEVALNNHWTVHQSLDETRQFIQQHIQASYAKGIPEPLGITLTENPEMIIGTVGVVPEKNRPHTLYFQYGLAHLFRGEGIIPEAGQLVLNYAFETFAPKRIWTTCLAENHASVRALEKMGFQQEGLHRAVVYHEGKYLDIWSLSCLLEEWNGPKPQETGS